MAFQRKLGEILVQAGIIDEFQLRSALGEQQRWGGRLGVTLIKLGFLEESDLTRALATQLDLPMVSLDGKRVQPEILARVPVTLAERHMALPLFARKEGGVDTLYIGMEDPCDLDALDELRFRAGMAVKPVLVGPSELCEGIDRFYHRPARNPAPAPEPLPEEMLPPVELAPEPTLPPTAPTEPEIEEPAQPEIAEPAKPAIAEPAKPAIELAPDSPPFELSEPGEPSATAPELSLDEPMSAPTEPPPASDVGAAASPALLFRALVQLLLDKGVVGEGELSDRVRDLKRASELRG